MVDMSHKGILILSHLTSDTMQSLLINWSNYISCLEHYIFYIIDVLIQIVEVDVNVGRIKLRKKGIPIRHRFSYGTPAFHKSHRHICECLGRFQAKIHWFRCRKNINIQMRIIYQIIGKDSHVQGEHKVLETPIC
jgi:hypothetical protein